MIGKDQGVSYDNIFPSPSRENDHLCNVIWSQRFAATGNPLVYTTTSVRIPTHRLHLPWPCRHEIVLQRTPWVW